MSFQPIYESSFEIKKFTIDTFMDYFKTPNGKKLLLDNNIKDVNEFHEYYLYDTFIKKFDFYIKENKKIDIVKMKNQIRGFCEELVSAVYHPKRLNYYLKKYNYNICDENYETNYQTNVDTNIENEKIKNNHNNHNHNNHNNHNNQIKDISDDFNIFHLHKKRKFSNV